MNDLTINIFGYIGSFLISINLIPQIIRTIQKKTSKNMSYITLGINLLACFFMITYGYKKNLNPIIISNIVICICSITLICLKKYYFIMEKNQSTFDNNNDNNDDNSDNNNYTDLEYDGLDNNNVNC
jgi:uncharacterized protein with PQ loop repeat